MLTYTYQSITVPAGLAARLGVSPIAAELLCRRGIDTPEKLQELMGGDPEAAFAALRSLDGAEEAAALLKETIAARGPICVYHDYDADGVCAAAIAVELLTAFGGDVFPYANLRGGDGYGMSEGGVAELLRRRPDTRLILTVDNGISAAPAVDYARSLGLTVLVTDHHEPPAELPAASVIVDPKCTARADTHLFCGASVALGVMLALAEQLGRGEKTVRACADLAALATIADSVPLTGYNRALFRYGLELIHGKARPAFFALHTVCALKQEPDAETIAYQYAPLLNAPSRVTGDCSPALHLLLSEDDDTALRFAGELADLNARRKELGEQQTAAALALLGEGHLSGPQLLLDDCFTEGIVGIVAGRVEERTGLPSILLARHRTPNGSPDGTVRASCRAPAGTGLVQVLETLHGEGLISVYGGHDQAAGFTARETDLPLLRRRFAELLPPVPADETRECDLRLTPADVTVELVRELERFAPFGEGFPPFLVELAGFRPAQVRYLGSTGAHVRITDVTGLSAVFWSCDPAEPLDVICRGRALHGALGLNRWRGITTAEFTAACEYRGGPLLLGCTNGETVEAVSAAGETLEVRYRGKLHTRPLSHVGVTLLPMA